MQAFTAFMKFWSETDWLGEDTLSATACQATGTLTKAEVVLQRKLAGLCPNDMLTAVAHGIKFWDYQLELRYRTELEKSFTAAQRNSEMYKRKLQVTNCARARRHVALALNRNIHVLRINQSSSLLR